MSFSRVNPPGWAFGDKLTSAQQNQLDSDHANALDKSVAGDSIAGTITFTGSGKIRTSSSDQIEIANGNGLIVSAGSGIVTTGSGSITAASTSGINSAVANGIVPLVAAGITDGGVVGGIQITVGGGLKSTILGGIVPTVAGGIGDGLAGGILISHAQGLQTFSLGSILLNAGVSDNIQYGTTRTLIKSVQLGVTSAGPSGLVLGTVWKMGFASGPALVGGATTDVLTIPLNDFFDGINNNATLTGATLVYAVGTSHGAVPAVLPFLNILRQPLTPGSSIGGVSLFSGGSQQIPSPGSGAAWYSSGTVQNFATTPNQNNAIQLRNYSYYATLQDESGANSIAGNMFFALILSFSGISNSAAG